MHGLPAADLQAYPPHRWRPAGQCPARWLTGGLAAPAPRARVDCGAGGGWLRAAGGAGGLSVLEALALLLYWLYWCWARQRGWVGLSGVVRRVGSTRTKPEQKKTSRFSNVALDCADRVCILLTCGR